MLRLRQQLFLTHLHRYEGLFVELFIFVVTEPRTNQCQVFLADNQTVTRFQPVCHRVVSIELTGILQGLVVTQESTDAHAMQTVILVEHNVEVAHQEIGEIIARQLIQQLVFVHRVGLIGQHKHKIVLALCTQFDDARRVGCERNVAPRPHIADIKLTSMQPAPLLHSFDNHTCQFTHLARGVFLYHLLQALHATVAIAIVQLAQSVDEEEFSPVLTQGEALCRELGVDSHLLMTICLKGLIGGHIERILDMFAKTCILLEIRIREQNGPLTFRLFLLHLGQTGLSLSFAPLERIEQEQVIERLVQVLVVGIVVRQSCQVLLTQRQVAQFVLEDHTRMEQTILDDIVRNCFLLIGKGNLRQIVLTLVGIVFWFQVVLVCLVLFLLSLLRSLGFQTIGGLCHTFCRFLLSWHTHHGLVHTLPVILILTPTPLALEQHLSLIHSLRIIEVPLAVALLLLHHRSLRLVTCSLPLSLRVGLPLHLFHLLLQHGVALLFLFLLQGLNHLVDSL